ncbi:hypothetical protein [Caudovirales GX15bay]|nr:hypothetical protein [Caudovirales GX15bay]
MDLSLPDMTGEEVLAALREIPTFEGTRVVALTADATATRERHLRSLGVDGYLVKPFGLPELTDLLRG